MLLLTKELLDAAEVGKLRQQWEGPFRVAALAGPNAETLSLPLHAALRSTWTGSSLTILGQTAPPRKVPGQEGEYVVKQLLNRQTICCCTHYLVQWQGQDPTADSWEPVEHLTNCSERIAEYEAAAP